MDYQIKLGIAAVTLSSTIYNRKAICLPKKKK